MQFPHTDADLERIQRESVARTAREPHANGARYDAATGHLEITLRGDTTVSVPARRLRGLGHASDEQLAQVRVVDGRALDWEELDVQMTLLAVLSDSLGLASGVTRRTGIAPTPRAAKS